MSKQIAIDKAAAKRVAAQRSAAAVKLSKPRREPPPEPEVEPEAESKSEEEQPDITGKEHERPSPRSTVQIELTEEGDGLPGSDVPSSPKSPVRAALMINTNPTSTTTSTTRTTTGINSNSDQELPSTEEIRYLHKKILDLEKLLNRFTEQNDRLTVENEDLQYHIENSHRSRSNSPAHSISTHHNYRDTKLAHPEKFTGKPKDYKRFVNAVNNIFEVNPHQFMSDRAKTGYIGSLLTGTALDWYQILVENQSDTLRDLKKFMKLFESKFYDKNFVVKQRDMLAHIKQGNRNILTYTTEFENTLMRCGYSDDTVISDFYYRGLNSEIKDGLVSFDIPEEYWEIQRFASKIEDRLNRRKVEIRNERHAPQARSSTNRSQSNRYNESRERPRDHQPREKSRDESKPRKSPSTSSSSSKTPKSRPMPRLSDEEKD